MASSEKNTQFFDGGYIPLAATVLCLYEHVITFPEEIEHIWRRRLSTASVLFVINRYAASVSSLARILQVLPWNLKHVDDTIHELDLKSYNEICSISLRLVDSCLILIYLSYNVLAALRICALYNMKKSVLLAIVMLGLPNPGGLIFLIAIGTTGANKDIGGLGSISFPLGRINCHYGTQARVDAEFGGRLSPSIGYLLPAMRTYSVIFDTIVIGLTWRKTFITWGLQTGAARAPVSKMLLRDGTLYFLVIAVTATLNGIGVLATVVMHPTSTNVGIVALASAGPVADMVTSVCMSRFMLRLRAAAKERPISQHRTSRRTTLRFATMIETLVGDIGVDLSEETQGDVADVVGAESEGEIPRGADNDSAEA